MKYMLGIAYANRPDLLHQAVNSVQPFWASTVIIDNSEHWDLRHDAELASKVRIFEPPVPLNFTQTMNLLQRMAMEQQCDVLLFMHNDAEAHEGTPQGLLSYIEQLFASQVHWGVVFTHYDVLVAFNMNAVKHVGPWDTQLPQYFADNDYYYRVRLAGYQTLDSCLEVTHHNGSSTIQSDPYRKHVNGVTNPLYERYYTAKWGPPNKETWTTPFNK